MRLGGALSEITHLSFSLKISVITFITNVLFISPGKTVRVTGDKPTELKLYADDGAE